MSPITKDSFIELNARERVKAVLDEGTFQELLGPFDGLESPHLPPQGIVPQSDDGVVIGRGQIDGEEAVVISIEGSFQGGGIGEVSGAKIAGSLELALRDNKKGIKTLPVMLFDTGGVRLQEANYGLLAISEIMAAVIALRQHVPVVGVIPGNVGCFGGMSITAALFSHLIMTKGARFGLNGPEVIEQEAGIEEFDSSDRPLIWGTIGGTQRYSTGFVDELVDDDVTEIRKVIHQAFLGKGKEINKTEQVDFYHHFLSQIDPSKPIDSQTIRELWKQARNADIPKQVDIHSLPELDMPNSRGRAWFKSLSGIADPKGDIPSVLYGDSILGKEHVRYISVVPNPYNRFPRARQGEVGLDEGWAIAKCVRDAVEKDKNGDPRAIVAIVDVPSQAYGYREELLGIHFALAAAVDAYSTARLAGHPVISLIVGNAISGAFLAHGYQSNRILALNDDGVNVHAMSKQSAARITRRSIRDLEEATRKVPAMAYDVTSYSLLGALYELIDGIEADTPGEQDIQTIKNKLTDAIADTRSDPPDLSNRLLTKEAINGGRTASIKTRKLLEQQWNSIHMIYSS
ncbi:biotin-independent malonate decarboxylase subunit beta [Fictibacillus terranigra]|uniref:Biotin-independent malonate decarboxylase subunit beta n=1 Tax=Fictibacillus terranigra TaxID=3058424 RepID=A0ABT8EBQ5_9BACL|nr:biotin-independent malonate decarboxylase subunit beta [Fictibacillus sp. CENA-BCM004]MDN4075348.1 biotin-independent malonate decarboxylase subunit beta [Fictibacillus sp. CENA-BCM004]